MDANAPKKSKASVLFNLLAALAVFAGIFVGLQYLPKGEKPKQEKETSTVVVTTDTSGKTQTANSPNVVTDADTTSAEKNDTEAIDGSLKAKTKVKVLYLPKNATSAKSDAVYSEKEINKKAKRNATTTTAGKKGVDPAEQKSNDQIENW